MYDASFFRKDPADAARNLVGKSAVRYGQRKQISVGMVVCTDALTQPGDNDGELYRAVPGTILRYATRKGFRLALSCHEPGGSGITTLLKMRCGKDLLDAEEIYTALGGDVLRGRQIGAGGGLYFADSGLNAEDFMIDTEIPARSPRNRTAYFELRNVGQKP